MQRRVFSRAQAEAEFVHAMTRQVGYTAGAYSIKRMAEIVAHFDDATAYQFELQKKLLAVGAEERQLTDKYATDILHFAGELGIIQKLQGASAPHLARYVLTDAGVAIRAAREINPKLEQLVLEHLVLENDADAYLRVLSLLQERASQRTDETVTEFRDQIMQMREARLSWIKSAFPTKPILMRLVKGGPSQIHWLKANRVGLVELDRLSNDFGRHHFSPRKSWATEMGHCSQDGRTIAERGLDLLKRSGWDGLNRAGQHWITPSQETLEYLRISSIHGLFGVDGPTLDLLRPKAEIEVPDAQLVELTADFLRRAFVHIRLFHARQAPTSPAIYLTVDYERTSGRRFNHTEVLAAVAKEYGHEFSFLSSRSGALAYYQLRRAANG